MEGKVKDMSNINPFVKAAQDVFQHLFNAEIKKGDISDKINPSASYEVAIIIGVSGTHYTGVVVFSMARSTAVKIVKAFDAEMDVDEESAGFADALGELANIISGNALSEFSKEGVLLTITTPSVVIGQAFEVHLLDQKTITVEVVTPYGNLQINIAIKKF